MINSTIIFFSSIIFLAFLMFCCFNIIFSVLSFAPWVPSRSRDMARIFKMAGLKEGQTFYDLGCGDGKVVIYASKNFKVKGIGLEISLPMYLICKLRQMFMRNKNINFKFRNLFKENLASADVVYFFGMPETINKKLGAKLKQELKPGTKIISYSFSLIGWTPTAVDKPSEKDLPVYLYIA